MELDIRRCQVCHCRQIVDAGVLVKPFYRDLFICSGCMKLVSSAYAKKRDAEEKRAIELEKQSGKRPRIRLNPDSL